MTRANSHYGYLRLKDGRAYIFPLAGTATARALDVYSAQTMKARAGKRLLALTLRLGAGSYVLPHAGIANSAGEAELLDYLRKILGQPDLSFSISLGLPGPHRKPVLQAMNSAGTSLAFIKVGWNAASKALVRRETDTLRRFQQFKPSGFITPAVIYSGEWHGEFICVQSALPQSASPPLTFGPIHRDIIRAMSTYSPAEQLLTSSLFWQTLHARVACLPHGYYRSLLESAMNQICGWVGDQPVPFHFCHGDFAPWNSRQVGSTLLLYDWEYACPASPAGWDIIRFFIQTQRLLERRSTGDIVASFQADGCAGRALSEHLQHLGASPGLADKLFALYLLDQLALYAAECPSDLRALQHGATLLNLWLLRTASYLS